MLDSIKFGTYQHGVLVENLAVLEQHIFNWRPDLFPMYTDPESVIRNATTRAMSPVMIDFITDWLRNTAASCGLGEELRKIVIAHTGDM